jgi:hypothetical protein
MIQYARPRREWTNPSWLSVGSTGSAGVADPVSLGAGEALGESVGLGVGLGPVGVGTGGTRQSQPGTDGAGAFGRRGGAPAARGVRGRAMAWTWAGVAVGTTRTEGAPVVVVPAVPTSGRRALPRPIPAVASAPAAGAASGYGSAPAGFSASSEPSPFTTAK